MTAFIVWDARQPIAEQGEARHRIEAIGPREAAILFVQRELEVPPTRGSVDLKVRCEDGTIKSIEVGVEMEPKFYPREVAGG